jgi:hypothetical protein
LPSPQRSAGASAAPLPELLADLTTLRDGDKALYICLEYRGALFSVKSPGWSPSAKP